MDPKDVSGLGGLQAPAAYRRDRRDDPDDGKEKRQHLWQEAMERSKPAAPDAKPAAAQPLTGLRPMTGLPPLPELLPQLQEDAPGPKGMAGDQDLALKRFRKALREALAAQGLNDNPSARELEAAIGRAIASVRADPGLPSTVLETIQALAVRLKDPATVAKVLRGGLQREDALSELLA